ncbi:MAG: glycyl-radical enzyme activating protein [Calditrichia bacterium]
MKAIVFDIKRFAIHDGPGIRTTVFLKGCPLSCWWCHNPESIKMKPEPRPEGFRSRYLQIRGGDPGMIGREISLQELVGELVKDQIVFEESGGGVTFSGGEPLLQAEFVAAAFAELNRRGIHCTLDTCGEVDWSRFEIVLPYTQLVLYDLKLMDTKNHLKHTGKKNDRILANLRRLLELKFPLRLRIPLIPGATDTPENLDAIIRFLKEFEAVIPVDLLPFNQFAPDKFRRMGLEIAADHLKEQSQKELENLKTRFVRHGITAEIGG